jgi:ABC-type spermidine/putrescine transport system permease subunit I
MILIIIFFLIPLVTIVVYGFYTRVSAGSMTADFTLDNYNRLFTSPVYYTVILRTLKLAVETTVATLAIGFPLAYWLARKPMKFRNVALLAIMIPFWSNLVIRSYGWIVILGNNGLINNFLGIFGIGPVPLVFNETGVIIGLVHAILPYMVFPLYASLSAINPSVEQAAKGLGANPIRTLWHITVPLALPGIASGVLLVFIITCGFYLTPVLLGGGRVIVIPALIEQQVAMLNYPFASVLAMVLLVIVMALIALFNKLIGLEKLGGGIYVA